MRWVLEKQQKLYNDNYDYFHIHNGYENILSLAPIWRNGSALDLILIPEENLKIISG